MDDEADGQADREGVSDITMDVAEEHGMAERMAAGEGGPPRDLAAPAGEEGADGPMNLGTVNRPAQTGGEAGEAYHQWQYWDDTKRVWCNMDSHFCKLHDQVVNHGATTFEYKYRRMNGQYFYYSVDLTLMVQENTTTGTIRQIRRLVPSNPFRRGNN